ncbi:MAG TPA: peptidylprolyl isomerase, partial [Thermohalobaculum sp.]|nr:peptidylprolyl isomerase [Thermohalobaculum sp.]
MKSTTLSAAAAGFAMAASLAMAQTATETGTAATPETTAAPAVEATLETALAEVNGSALTLGELLTLRRELPQQYQQLPDEVLFNGLVEQLIDQMLLADAAQKAGLEDGTLVKLSLALQSRAILANAYLQHETNARISPEALDGLYAERYTNAAPVPEVRAAHILVKTQEEAAELKTQLDGGADFAALAAEHGTDGTKDRGGELGWFVQGDMV